MPIRMRGLFLICVENRCEAACMVKRSHLQTLSTLHDCTLGIREMNNVNKINKTCFKKRLNSASFIRKRSRANRWENTLFVFNALKKLVDFEML